MTRRMTFLWVMMTALLMTVSTSAQSGDTAGFTSDDGTVIFQHPRAWTVADRGGGLVSLSGVDFSATLYSPAALVGSDEPDPGRIALNYVLNRRYAPGALNVFASGGKPAARQDYTGSEVPAGFVLAFGLEAGSAVIFDATTSGDSRILQRDLEILMTTFSYSETAAPPAPFSAFTTADSSVSFEYPRAWQVTDNGDGTAQIENADFTGTLYSAAALAQFNVDDPARLVAAKLESSGWTPGEFSVFLSSRRPAARFDYLTPDGSSGFLLGFTLADASLLLLDVTPAHAGNSTAAIQKDLEILVASVNGDGSAVVTATRTPTQAAGSAPTDVPSEVEFVSNDGTLTLTYLDTWFFGQDETGKIYGFLGDPAVSLTIYPPEVLVQQRYLMNGEAPESFLGRYRSNFGLAMSDIETVTLGELTAAKREVTLEAGGEFVALQLPGGAYAVAEGFMFSGDLTREAERAIEDVLATITYTGSVVAQEITELPTPELTSYNATPDKAVIELENLGLIPFGGRLLAQETYLYFRGAGERSVRLTSLTSSENLVMAGQITFQTDQTEPGDTCALSARRVLEAGAPGELTFGITSDGLAFYMDESREPGTPVRTESTRLDGNVGDPHDLLIIAIDDRLTFYVDGQPIFVDVEVEQRPGIYALAVNSTSRGASCEGRNMWVYSLPDVVATGVCEVTTIGEVNKRSGPGTNFDVVSQLAAFSSFPVIGQTTGDDGFRWWHLDDDSWVRGDIVEVEGDCSQFMQNPPEESTPEATSEVTEAAAEATAEAGS